MNLEKQADMATHDHNHQELFKAAWEKSQQNEVIRWLNSGGKISEVIEKTPGFKEAFDHELDTLDCSDGRVRSGAKMGLAGEGIVADDGELRLLEAELIKRRERLGRKLLITGHESCGAAALMHPGPDSDREGYKKAQQLAETTGNEFRDVDHTKFISPVHNERALLIDCSGRFDVANWNNFPPQFISSAPAFNLGDDYLRKEMPALTNIALGDHGLGERFTPETPFYIIISANNESELEHFKALASETLEKFGDRVKVDGFVVPEEKN